MARFGRRRTPNVRSCDPVHIRIVRARLASQLALTPEADLEVVNGCYRESSFARVSGKSD
jgi:hypothetical protein